MTTYTIKPLAFKRREDAEGNGYSVAETPFGDVTVYPHLDGSGYYWEWSEGKDYGGTNSPTIGDAEAAARVWWRERMIEGLEEVTPAMIHETIRKAYCVAPEELAG